MPVGFMTNRHFFMFYTNK